MQEKQRAQDAQKITTGTRGLPDAEGGALAKGTRERKADNPAPEATPATVDAEGDLEGMGEAIKAAFEGDAQLTRQHLIERARRDLGDGVTLIDPQELQSIREAAETVYKSVSDYIQSESFIVLKKHVETIKEELAALAEHITKHRGEWQALSEGADYIWELAPFIELELTEAQQDPALQGVTIDDLIDQCFDLYGNKLDSPLIWIVEKAEQRKAEFDEAEKAITDVELAAEELPRIISNPTDLLTYPLDKPNSRIWNLITGADANGQIALEIDTTSDSNRRKGREAIISYALSFADLEPGMKITRQTTPFDKRVYIAAAALYNAGNHIVTATQIYKMMGNRGQPNKDDVKKINNSLDKMGPARVYIDSTQEVKVNKGYTAFKYDGPLLPFERVSAYINNTLAESAVHLFREPPLITFARSRKQITSVSRKLLESPISKTDANLMIEDYLIERISHMRSNPRLQRKILFSTIYERCLITSWKQRSRTPEKIKKLLDHQKACDFIKGYDMGKDGVVIWP